MASFSLFAAGPQVLFDDASGRVAYTPDVVPAETAQAWFTQLFEGIAWRGGRRVMYEREVDVARLSAHFDLADPAPPHEASAPPQGRIRSKLVNTSENGQ